ncbi:hypothetical protein DYQ91_02470 [Xanthomonas sp. LMG 8989]|nr:hypothetical protein [Xanthomonas sp. LMG 8989]
MPLPLPLPLLRLLLLFWLLTYRVPFRSGEPGGKHPKGGAQGCAPSAAGAGCPFRGSRLVRGPGARSAEGA